MNLIEFSKETSGHRLPQYLFIVVNFVSAIAAAVGNSLVLVTIWRTPRLHSPSNVLLAGLAVSDLGVGLICQPFWIIEEMTSNTVHDIVSWIYCLSADFFVEVSLVTLTAISVDRYLALKLHLRYRELVTVKRVLIVLVTIWMVDILLFIWEISHNLSAFVLQLSLFVMCVLLTVCCYFKVFQIIRRHQIQIQAQVILPYNAGLTLPNVERHKKSVLTMLYIVGIFMINYFPFLTVVAVHIFTRNRDIDSTLRTTVLTVLFVNSCVNPALYCWRMVEIRQAAKETLLSMCS